MEIQKYEWNELRTMSVQEPTNALSLAWEKLISKFDELPDHGCHPTGFDIHNKLDNFMPDENSDYDEWNDLKDEIYKIRNECLDKKIEQNLHGPALSLISRIQKAHDQLDKFITD